jgi:hypothetical protein
MEPREDESPQLQELPEEGKEGKPRFQVIKLEERIAPDKGGHGVRTRGPGHTCQCCRCGR